nr:PREDICTED: protocadherin alpha-C1-like [Latimeria chalumnae]|eukprot:XP_014351001.1 PREDICTED: protocadherin alpha-C1-like [Latimeria chalumnae]
MSANGTVSQVYQYKANLISVPDSKNVFPSVYCKTDTERDWEDVLEVKNLKEDELTAVLSKTRLWSTSTNFYSYEESSRGVSDMASLAGDRAEGKMLLLFLLYSILRTVSGLITYSIPEETEQGTSVGNIAKDLGINDVEVPSRKFKIVSASKQYLNVTPNTGIIFVNERIDREEICGSKTTCLLNIQVVMENPLEIVNIELSIIDINDNSPSFPLNVYLLNISEFVPIGARFKLQNALDPDVNTNTLRTYSLDDSDHFDLNIQILSDGNKVPELILKKPLDREKQSFHHLTLTAVDGGVPVRSGTATINILVLDVNDNVPVFDQAVYRADLMENAPKGTLVIKVNATDLDEGRNGEVVYSFSSNTPKELKNMFTINAETGEIVVNKILGFEDTTLEIFIDAIDKGVLGQSSSAKLLVQIIDVNNNVPEIMITSVSSPVPEDAVPGTAVALFRIIDKDPGENGRVHCYLPDKVPFKLKPSFGNYYTLVTDGFLDRELNKEYNITIIATDSGSPPFSKDKTILIQISDVNDNPPEFEKTEYSVHVIENNFPGSSIFQIAAFDPDLGEHGHISYSIIESKVKGQSVLNFLSISPEKGIIYAKRTFDYEELKDLQIQVKAKDGGIPSLSSDVTLKVFIVDQNDNAPFILYPATKDGSVPVEIVPKSADANYLVTKVVADDADMGQNAWLTYQVLQSSGSNLFNVTPHTGEIRSVRPIRSSDAVKQKLVILVRDNGQPSLSSTVTIGVLLADSLPQSLPSFVDGSETEEEVNNLNFYLILSLASISVLFFGFIIFLIFIQIHQYKTNSSQDRCSSLCCCFDEFEIYKLNFQFPQNYNLSPHIVEMTGNGTLSQVYQYKATLSSLSECKNAFPRVYCKPDTGCKAGEDILVKKDEFTTVLSIYKVHEVIIGNT